MQPAAVFAALAVAGDLYPGFDAWFWETLVPGIGRDRAIFLEWAGDQIAGVVLAKRSSAERKLCTIWVDERYRMRGVAARLVDQSCVWLGTNSPMLTIPSERILEFVGILRSAQFAQTQVLDGYYRVGSREYVFNGNLPLMPKRHAAIV